MSGSDDRIRADDDLPRLPPLDGLAGRPARPIEAKEAAAIVRAALREVHDQEQLAEPISEEQSEEVVRAALDEVYGAPRRAKTLRRYAVAAAAVLTLGTISAGGAWAAMRYFRASTPEPTRADGRHQGRRRVEPPDQPTPTSPPEAASTIDPGSEDVVHAPAHRRRRASAPRIPADLLKNANELRAQRRWADAERAYRNAAAAFPNTSESYTATLAAATLRLDHLRDPSRALQLFRAVLRERPEGSLAEEAQFGIAECERALRHRDREAAALRELIRAHPHSVMRARAEARLAELRAVNP